MLYVNPGSIRMPRGRSDKTYVLMDLENGQANVRFYRSEDGSAVEDLDVSGKL
ncbi:hypothetical protein [Exiguobacterium mexicanum]|uniref:hypothetical protein n=1 Tax=Exiguobacterium mexicanum TaxID=340146 RepID=UPI0037BE8330